MGTGTTVTIDLPRCAPAADSQTQRQETGPLRGVETGLLVEDDPMVLEIGKTMLERLGCTVLAASTPTEAIGIAAQNAGRPDLAVTDVVRPEMNGVEVSKRLLALQPDLKVAGHVSLSVERRVDSGAAGGGRALSP